MKSGVRSGVLRLTEEGVVWNRILELSAAGLVAFALWGDFIKSAPADESCFTVAGVNEVLGEKPTLELTGDALKSFTDNYTKSTGLPPPDGVEEIAIWGQIEDVPETSEILFLTFHGGCAVKSLIVPAHEFMAIWKGNQT